MTYSSRILMTIFLLAAPVAHGEEWQASRVWTTGSDSHTWVIGAADTADSVLPLMQIWYTGKAIPRSTAPSLLATLPPISGNPLFVGADNSALHVLFADLSQCDYRPDKPLSPGPAWNLQSRKPPLAWCGDASLESVWAVVENDGLVQPTTTAIQDDDSDGDDVDEIAASAPTTLPSQPATAHTLLHLRGGVWSRANGPESADHGEQFWLAARSGIVHLFWRQGQSIFESSLKEGHWSSPRTVLTDAEIKLAWAGITKEHPVMAVGVPTDDGRMQLHLHASDVSGTWSRLGIARENDEYLSLDPVRCGVSIGQGQLNIVRIGKGGTVEFGAGDVATLAPIRFAPLSLRRPDAEFTSDWRDSLSLAMALMILTVVMWTRRQQLTGEIILPQGFIPSAVWRRLMATVLDFAPAALILTPWAIKAVPELSQIADIQSLRDRIDEPGMQEKLMPVQTATFIVYGLWCMIWELIINTTPGKYLFGCRVLSVSGEKPLAKQIVVRNVVRALMVGIGPPGWIITLMMMGMLSRNRQRVGDLMAGTVVVEEGMPEEEQPPPADDGPFG